MDIDYAETTQATRRLRQLADELRAGAQLGGADTGSTPDVARTGDLSSVERGATRLAARIARLGGALAGFSQEARDADDAHAHRLVELAAAAREVR